MKNKGYERSIIVCAIVCAFGAWFFGFRPFLVSGVSMYPTFNGTTSGRFLGVSGDYLIIDIFSHTFLGDPQRYEVVVFKSPIEEGRYLLKRVVGLPNEQISFSNNTIKITTEDGQTFSPDEPYLNQEEIITYKNQTIQLKSDEYVVLGDNRTNSLDSRSWGSLTKDRIIGRVLFRLFPLASAEIFPGNVDRDVLSEI